MKNYNEILKKMALKPISYEKRGHALIIGTKNKKYVIKESDASGDIMAYLKARGFDNLPKTFYEADYVISEYLEEISLPKEQKLEEMMKLLAIMHSKTTYFERTDTAYNKEIYEDLKSNIAYLRSYYEDIITLIESHEFMSPSEYLFARNYTIIMNSLNYAASHIDDWYDRVRNSSEVRIAVIHSNLSLEHFIYGNSKAFISFRKARFGSPIFDLVTVFKKYGEDNFKEKLAIYEKIYPLRKEELELLYIFISLPPKFEFKGSEYDLCEDLTKKVELLYLKDKIVLPDEFKNRKENNQNENQNHKDTKLS